MVRRRVDRVELEEDEEEEEEEEEEEDEEEAAFCRASNSDMDSAMSSCYKVPKFGSGRRFLSRLDNDLRHPAAMVRQCCAGVQLGAAHVRQRKRTRKP
jgi:hypothetical protein